MATKADRKELQKQAFRHAQSRNHLVDLYGRLKEAGPNTFAFMVMFEAVVHHLEMHKCFEAMRDD